MALLAPSFVVVVTLGACDSDHGRHVSINPPPTECQLVARPAACEPYGTSESCTIKTECGELTAVCYYGTWDIPQCAGAAGAGAGPSLGGQGGAGMGDEQPLGGAPSEEGGAFNEPSGGVGGAP